MKNGLFFSEVNRRSISAMACSEELITWENTITKRNFHIYAPISTGQKREIHGIVALDNQNSVING